MRDSLTPDELADFLAGFSERHHASAGDTVQFLLELARELSSTEPERLADVARSLDGLLQWRNDFRLFAAERLYSKEASTRTNMLHTIYSVMRQRELSRDPEATLRARGWGAGRGLLTIADTFDDPLPADILDEFES